MNEQVITVTHSESAELAADTVKITVTASAESKKYDDAAQKAEAIAGEAVAGLKNIGLDVRASGMNVHAIRAERKVTGYRAVRSYSVEFAVSDGMLAKALDVLSASGCEFGVSFALNSREHGDGLLTRAVENARARAEVIAKAAGVKLGKLVKVEHMSNGGARPMMMFARSAGNGAADAEPALIHTDCTVTCSWAIA